MSKRAAGEGSVFKNQSKGLWVAKVNVGGKPVERYAKTQALALEKLSQLNKEKSLGINITSTMKLNEFLPEWLEVHRNTIRVKTYVGYEQIIRNHLIPRFGKYKLNALTPEIITNTWNKMIKEGYTPNTISHCQARLSVALNVAVRRGFISGNPCMYATKPKSLGKEINIIDDKDVTKILDAAKPTEYYEIIFMALQTGMRRGELCALQWRDINLLYADIYVNRTIYVSKGGVKNYQPPKTKSGKREIALVPEAVNFLKSMKKAQRYREAFYHSEAVMEQMIAEGHSEVEAHALSEVAFKEYEVDENSHVFQYLNGRQILPDAVTGYFKKIVKKPSVELPKAKFHDLRHTHAGILLKMNINPKVVQERLGHSSIQVTMDIYSHITPNMQRDAIKGFSLFNQPV